MIRFKFLSRFSNTLINVEYVNQRGICELTEKTKEVVIV